MHKLAVLRNAPMVSELMRRLEEASIDAFYTSEKTAAELHLGGATSMSVWVKDEDRVAEAAEILQEIDPNPVMRCPSCGYDLRGHSGKIQCPECGLALLAGETPTEPAPDRPCPRCNEAVPSTFEICWNCGAELSATA